MEYNLNDLNNTNPKIKYAMQKTILNLSETNPKVLYKDFDYFVDLLSNTNNILLWTGILVLGNLSSVDTKNKIDKVLHKIVECLNMGKMITAANTVKSLVKIASSKPEMTDMIAIEILKTKDYNYDSDECSNILIGYILKNIPDIWDLLSDKNKQSFINLASHEINNSRPATAKKAEAFLSLYSV
jgi:hypothetical protein